MHRANHGANAFSALTLEKFEDASASVVLRQIDRAFAGANIRLGDDPGGIAGDRRSQFRRYVASVDQNDPRHVERLGHALGALIELVASSKEAFLVNAAASDGFVFANGAFRFVEFATSSFTVVRVEDLAQIDDRGRRLRLLANDRPADAVDGAMELAESVCRTVLHAIGEPKPQKTAGLADIVSSTLHSLAIDGGNVVAKANEREALSRCIECLGAENGLSPRYARLAIGVAITFAEFVAETYAARATAR